MLEQVITEHPGGLPVAALYRSERHWVCCRGCRRRHEFYPVSDAHRTQVFDDFECRHRGPSCYVFLMTPDRVEALARRTERQRKRFHAARAYAHNASVLTAFQASDQSLDLTSFNSLASSATAGWSSNWIDNSSNLYLDYVFAVTIASVATAPGSDQYWYFFAASALNTTDRPATGASGGVCANSASTAATLTFPSISTTPPVFPFAWKQPYNTTTIAQQSPLWGIARCSGGVFGLYLWIPMINFSGMTIAASGNALKYRGVYNTVA